MPSSDLTLCWCSLWTKTQLEYIIIIIGKLSRNGLFSTAMWHDRTVKRSDFCKEEKCSQREWRFITIICCCAGMSVWKLDDTVKSKKFLNCLLNGHLKMVFCHLKRHTRKKPWDGTGFQILRSHKYEGIPKINAHSPYENLDGHNWFFAKNVAIMYTSYPATKRNFLDIWDGKVDFNCALMVRCGILCSCAWKHRCLASHGGLWHTVWPR